MIENKAIEYENAIRVKKIATKGEGTEYTFIPEPKTLKEAFERFQKLNAQLWSEGLQRNYLRNNENPTLLQFEVELERLENFIKNAEQLSRVKAFKDFNKTKEHFGYEYLRLKNDFYLKEPVNHISDMVYGEYFLYYDWIKGLIAALPPQQTETKTEKEKEKETPKIFEELFYDINFVTPCIDLLKEIEPPLIDTECNYIGNLKGAFCVWIDQMQQQGIVKHFSDRKIFASLLPQKIKRFSIDESMFGKRHRKAENQYKADIKTLLSQIKLSQNSQKGELGK